MEFVPPDEYDDECRLIVDESAKEKELLGVIIYKIFKYNFGEAFQVDVENCLEVATEIENKLSKN